EWKLLLPGMLEPEGAGKGSREEALDQGARVAGAVRRVGEGHVEVRTGPVQVAEDVIADDRDLVGGFERLDVVPERAEGVARALDEHHLVRSPAERLESERPRAGEEVDYAGPRDLGARRG